MCIFGTFIVSYKILLFCMKIIGRIDITLPLSEGGR
jgi:hypothetical protein